MFSGVTVLSLCMAALLTCPASAAAPANPAGGETMSFGPEPIPAASSMTLDLSGCIEIAMENNGRRRVSQDEIRMAESKRRQALSSWWPSLTAEALGSYMDEDPNFVFPGRSLSVPPFTFTLPANTFGPGFPPVDVDITTPSKEMQVPDQEIKLMDRTNLIASLGLSFPLYTGGLRPALIRQAEVGVEIARHEGRRTDQEVVHDVKRAYYGAVLLRRLVVIGEDTLSRMEATLSFTESLYKEGSGTVKKTDYLRNKTAVEGLRTLVEGLKAKEDEVSTALAMLLELDTGARVEPVTEQLPYATLGTDAVEFIDAAQGHNPRLAAIEAALEAAEAGIRAARSGHYPKAELRASLTRIENSYDAGLVTPENSSAATIGVAVQFPLFDGFLTKNRVREAQAFKSKLEHQRDLLRRSIALDIERCATRILHTQEQEAAARGALEAAVENRQLNARAYQADIVETQDVIEAQITEALMDWQYQKVLYDHVLEQAKLELLIGAGIDAGGGNAGRDVDDPGAK
jgi:outer membrane protein